MPAGPWTPLVEKWGEKHKGSQAAAERAQEEELMWEATSPGEELHPWGEGGQMELVVTLQAADPEQGEVTGGGTER